MSSDQTHPGSPVDSLESHGAAGRSADAADEAACGTSAACGACSLSGDGGCGTAPLTPEGEPTAPVGCSAAAPITAAPELTWREKVSTRLAVLPPAAIAPIVIGLVVAGLLTAGPLGGVLLALGVAALLGIFALTWPQLATPEKALRIAVLAFVLGLTAIRFIPN